jgi:hypothetical protein
MMLAQELLLEANKKAERLGALVDYRTAEFRAEMGSFSLANVAPDDASIVCQPRADKMVAQMFEYLETVRDGKAIRPVPR